MLRTGIPAGAFVLVAIVSHAWAEPLTPAAHAHPCVEKIRAGLPAGWSCLGDHRCIVVSRDEPVTRLNLMSLPAAPRQELADRMGVRTRYLIVLTFRPRLSEEQLESLKALRMATAEAVDDDAKRSASAREWRKFSLPTYYGYGSSIYVHRTDEGPVGIYPESAAEERDAVLGVLDALFEKY